MDPGYVLLIFIISAGFTFFYYLKSHHLEQMARIEHGYDDNVKSKKNNVFRNLAIILSMVSVGIITAYLLDKVIQLPLPILLLTSVFLFSALAFYLIHKLNR